MRTTARVLPSEELSCSNAPELIFSFSFDMRALSSTSTARALSFRKLSGTRAGRVRRSIPCLRR